MKIRICLAGVAALSLTAGTAVAPGGHASTGLPNDPVPSSNPSRPPAPETPPGDLTSGTEASESPDPIAPPMEPATTGMSAPTAATESYVEPARRVTTMAPIPDTAENRRVHGGPNSRGGRATSARGN